MCKHCGKIRDHAASRCPSHLYGLFWSVTDLPDLRQPDIAGCPPLSDESLNMSIARPVGVLLS